MKKLIFSSLLSLLFLSTGFAQYDDEVRSGYEGDFFSLEGALELFKDAHSIRNFERRLNSENSYVNNLDLNYDGRTDYIRVEHRRSGRYHAIVMQAIVNRRELQDVAVIEFERINGRKVMLQIVGDEDLYGERVVIESFDDAYYNDNDYYVNAYHWPIMQSIFAPTYVTYVSPYAFSYYPSWYRPWNPCAWNVFYPRVVRYRSFYRVAPYYRLTNVYNFYRPYRQFCPSVRQNTVYVRSTRGRNSYYYGSNRRYNRVNSAGNRVANNSNGQRYGSRNHVKPGNGKAKSTYGAVGKNSQRGNVQGGAKSNRPTRVTRPTTSRVPGKNSTISKRPTSKQHTTRGNSGFQSQRPARKPAVSKNKPSSSYRPSAAKKPSRSTYRPNTSAKKPARKPQASRPSYNNTAKRPSVSKRPSSSRPSGISRGSSQVRKPASRSKSSSRSSSVRTAPKRSSVSPSRSTRSSKPAARPSTKRSSSSKSSVSSRSKSSSSSSRGRRH